MVDGGTSYLRYGAADMDKIRIFAVYADDLYETVRQYATRGGMGKDGTEPLKYVPICDINDNWLEAILDYGGAAWHMDLIKKEVQYRKDNNIKIPE